MAEKKLFVGTVGPFLYDDTDLIEDIDGDFAGQSYDGFMTTGQVYVEGTPTLPNHVARQIDIPDNEEQLEATSYFFSRIY